MPDHPGGSRLGEMTERGHVQSGCIDGISRAVAFQGQGRIPERGRGLMAEAMAGVQARRIVPRSCSTLQPLAFVWRRGHLRRVFRGTVEAHAVVRRDEITASEPRAADRVPSGKSDIECGAEAVRQRC